MLVNVPIFVIFFIFFIATTWLLKSLAKSDVISCGLVSGLLCIIIGGSAAVYVDEVSKSQEFQANRQAVMELDGDWPQLLTLVQEAPSPAVVAAILSKAPQRLKLSPISSSEYNYLWKALTYYASESQVKELINPCFKLYLEGDVP